MRKIIFVIFLIFGSIFTFGKFPNNITGSWAAAVNDSIVYTFVSDTLYIDEIGNEGFAYNYSYTDSCMIATSINGDTIVFNIDEINDSCIAINFINENEQIIFNKLETYNFFDYVNE